MALEFKREYEGEWKISTPAKPTDFNNIITPSFSPLPDNYLTFRFEAFYQQLETREPADIFKLKLVKLTSSCITPKLEVSADVKLYYSDGYLFVDYPDLPPTSVDEINDVTFKDVIRELNTRKGYHSVHYDKMASSILIINCKMTLYGQHQVKDNTPANDIKLSKYVDLTRNLTSVYESSVLSDFTFIVGDRSFSAHKVILAANSPVFMKLMTKKFLESKTDTVTISDATPEIFGVFLSYLYSGEIDDQSWNSLRELYYLADKYDVRFLKAECAAGTISVLSVDLVCEILKLAYNYSDSDIKKAAIDFAVNHIKELILRDDWKELVKTQPRIGYEVIVNFISP